MREEEIQNMQPVEAYEAGKQYAYDRAIQACDINTTAEQVKDDIENILRKPEIYE